MGTTVTWILGIIFFLIVIAVSIGLHEAGHMVTAKMLKIPVPKFFVGFGPTIWSFKKNGTEYGVKAIPLGGYIQVEDPTQPEGSAERSLLSYVSPWKRFLIFIAGPAVNIVLGFIILFNLLVSTPQNVLSKTIATVNDCNAQPTNCQAYKAGFRNGDTVSKIDGNSNFEMNLFNESLKKDGSHIEVIRDGKPINLFVVPNENKKIGIILNVDKRNRTASESITTINTFFKMNVEAIGKIPSQVPGLFEAISGKEKRSTDSMSSIIGAGRAYGDIASEKDLTADDKFNNLVLYSALMNLGLGFVNLLPLLPLDGGRIFIAFIDAVKIGWSRLRKRVYTPLNTRWVSVITAVTGTMVLGFSLLLILADIVAPVATS